MPRGGGGGLCGALQHRPNCEPPLPEGCIRKGGRGRGGLKGGRAVWLGPPPSSQGPPVVPAEGRPNILKRKSS